MNSLVQIVLLLYLWIVFLVQNSYLVLLLFAVSPAFGASYLSLQKVAIKMFVVFPIIAMSSVQAQICFNLVVICLRTSKLLIAEPSTTLNC